MVNVLMNLEASSFCLCNFAFAVLSFALEQVDRKWGSRLGNSFMLD